MNKFIVIEGLDATGKSTLVDKLSILLDAVQLSCPPEILIPSIVDVMLDLTLIHWNPPQRRAYYRFSNL